MLLHHLDIWMKTYKRAAITVQHKLSSRRLCRFIVHSASERTDGVCVCVCVCVKEMMSGTGRRIDGTQYTYIHTTVVEGHPTVFFAFFLV